MAVLGATSLTGCNSIPGFMPGTADVGASATRTVFRMATSPTSWTKDTTAFEGTLRLVNGASLSPGGLTPFTSVFTASAPVSGTLDSAIVGLSIPQAAAFPTTTLTSGTGGPTSTQPTSLSLFQIVAHTHPYISPSTGSLAPGTTANHAAPGFTGANFTPAGQSGGHTHAVDAHDHQLLGSGRFNQHSHTISGQHSHTLSTTQDFSINYVDIIISIKN